MDRIVPKRPMGRSNHHHAHDSSDFMIGEIVRLIVRGDMGDGCHYCMRQRVSFVTIIPEVRYAPEWTSDAALFCWGVAYLPFSPI